MKRKMKLSSSMLPPWKWLSSFICEFNGRPGRPRGGDGGMVAVDPVALFQKAQTEEARELQGEWQSSLIVLAQDFLRIQCYYWRRAYRINDGRIGRVSSAYVEYEVTGYDADGLTNQTDHGCQDC